MNDLTWHGCESMDFFDRETHVTLLTSPSISLASQARSTNDPVGNCCRLAYVGEVPVQATFHGSAVLHRLFSMHADECRIIELGRASDPNMRVPGAEYENVKYACQNIRRNGLGSLGRFLNYSLLDATIRRVRRACEDAEAIVTVAHGLGWFVADEVAAQLHKPLHLVVHDYPSPTFPKTPLKTKSIERAFLRTYARAASRMCVSSYMEEYYRERTRTRGQVLLPGRSELVSQEPYAPARPRGNSPFTIGLFGSLYSKSSIEVLEILARSIGNTFGMDSQINIYGIPPGVKLRSQINDKLLINFRGFIPTAEFVTLLRTELDALFLPVPFEESSLNMSIHFPSKLTDYTATGLPIVVCGPRSSSAWKWTSDFPSAFVVCESSERLPDEIGRLSDYDESVRLGRNSYNLGKQNFDYSLVGNQFWDTISGLHRQRLVA